MCVCEHVCVCMCVSVYVCGCVCVGVLHAADPPARRPLSMAYI